MNSVDDTPAGHHHRPLPRPPRRCSAGRDALGLAPATGPTSGDPRALRANTAPHRAGPS